MKQIHNNNLQHLSDAQRILVIKPSSLGDIFHLFPALARLREIFPAAQFDYLVHPFFAEALDYAPLPIAEKILFRRNELGHWCTFPGAAVPLVQALRKNPYDYIFDFQGLLRSALCARIASGCRVGFAQPREKIAAHLYQQRIAVEAECHHALLRNQALIERFINPAAPMPTADDIQLPAFPDRPEKRQSVLQKMAALGLQANRPILAIAPGARWISKCFPPDLFAAVIRLLHSRHSEWQFLLLGAPADLEEANAIQGSCPAQNVFSLVGATQLGELIEAIRLSQTLLSNDTGPIHIAAAAGVRVVSLYGSTRPEKTGPFGKQNVVLRRSDLPCIGCLKKVCPSGSLNCHKIEPELIAQTVEQGILSTKSQS